jgi:hypothetical protein
LAGCAAGGATIGPDADEAFGGLAAESTVADGAGSRGGSTGAMGGGGNGASGRHVGSGDGRGGSASAFFGGPGLGTSTGWASFFAGSASLPNDRDDGGGGVGCADSRSVACADLIAGVAAAVEAAAVRVVTRAW